MEDPRERPEWEGFLASDLTTQLPSLKFLDFSLEVRPSRGPTISACRPAPYTKFEADITKSLVFPKLQSADFLVSIQNVSIWDRNVKAEQYLKELRGFVVGDTQTLLPEDSKKGTGQRDDALPERVCNPKKLGHGFESITR